MLTLSVLWVVLAVTISIAALQRRSTKAVVTATRTDHESGKVLVFAAVLCSLVLLAGFVYVSQFFISGL